MRRDRRGCFWLIMIGMVLFSLVALMEAMRMLLTLQQEREEQKQNRQPKWIGR